MQSPSFNRYSSGTLEDTAARVVAEFADYFEDDVFVIEAPHPKKSNEQEQIQDSDDDEEFEFPSLFNNEVASAPADEIKHLVFPIFGHYLIDKTVERNSNPLWKLMSEEREAPASSSSSEADELDGIPAETYCIWSPKSAEGRCGKSHSTGSSKRWKIRDLVKRSNSDGKGSYVFQSPSQIV